MQTFVRNVVCLFILAAVTVVRGFAQDVVPNGGFETWSGGNPVGWVTDNVAGIDTPITQSSNAHGGASAVAGRVAMIFTTPIAGVIGITFSVSMKDAALTGYYQFAPTGGDRFFVGVGMSQGGNSIGTGGFTTATAAGSYTQFSIPITYNAGTPNPDSCTIGITILAPPAGGNPHPGTTYLVDDLALTLTSGVNDQRVLPAAFALHQNYPNPFNPSTVIEYVVPSAERVTLSVYNILGEKIATLVNGVVSPGIHTARFDASQLPSGTYIYRMSAGSFVQTRSMTLMK